MLDSYIVPLLWFLARYPGPIFVAGMVGGVALITLGVVAGRRLKDGAE